jgi:hypothetical protein
MKNKQPRLLALLIIGIAVLLLFLWTREAPPKAKQGAGASQSEIISPKRQLRPAQTRRAQAMLERNAPADEPASPKEAAEDEPVLIIVRLREPRLYAPGMKVIMGLRPSAFFPGTDEAPFPKGPATDRLQELLDWQPEQSSQDQVDALKARFLEASAELDVNDPAMTDDPWAGLLALEAERLRQRGRWSEALSDRDDSSERPRKQFDDLLSLADSLVERYPDDPIADYANIYVLHALNDSSSSAYDMDAAVVVTLDIIARTDDALVLENAVKLLTRHQNIELDAAALDDLEQIYGELNSGLTRQLLTRICLSAAAKNGDWERFAQWTDRQQKAVFEICESPDEGICSDFLREFHETEGLSSALLGREANTWQGALVAEIWSCYLRGEKLTTSPLTAMGAWEDAWVWSDWSERSGLATCIEESAPMVLPTGPVKATLRVFVREMD